MIKEFARKTSLLGGQRAKPGCRMLTGMMALRGGSPLLIRRTGFFFELEA